MKFVKNSVIWIVVLSLFLSSSFVNAVSSENEAPKIIINQVYGGNKGMPNDTPVSHSFIELYNPGDSDVDLKGWSLQYAETGDKWEVFPLNGVIPAKCSFLVRCGIHSSKARFSLDYYDMQWNILLHNKGLKVALMSTTRALNVKNPFKINSSGDKAKGYVDMLGVAGNEYYFLVDGYENDYSQIQSKQKAIRRINFQDTDNNAKDFSIVDYRVADLEVYRPRCTKDGQWAEIIADRINQQRADNDSMIPAYVTNIFGSNPGTERIFTYQTSVKVPATYIEIYESGSEEVKKTFDAVSNKQTNIIGDFMNHTVKVEGLKPSTEYRYRLGSEEHGFTDEGNFKTASDDDDEVIFIQGGDTQAFNQEQYDIWKNLTRLIMKNYDFDFFLHVGDMIETPDSEDEWQMFFNSSKDLMMNYAFVPVIGNHEEKLGNNAKSFTQHFTFPNQVKYEGVTDGTITSFDYKSIHFSILNSEGNLEKQAEWLKKDLARTDKKWKIVVIHRSPYGFVGRNNTIIFEQICNAYGVDLVLHGHDHVFSRTYPLVNGVVSERGTVYVQSGAAGIKQVLSGSKQKYHDFLSLPGKPGFSKIHVTKDWITIESMVENDNTLQKIDTYKLFKDDSMIIKADYNEEDFPVASVFEIVENEDNDVSSIFFSDVNILSKWAADDIDKMYNKNVFSADKNGLFNPLNTITEKEFVYSLGRLITLDYRNYFEYLTDNKITKYTACKIISTALGGNDDFTAFALNAKIIDDELNMHLEMNRAQAAVLLSKAEKFREVK